MTEAGTWTNWAGDQSCRPVEVVHPRSRDELAEAVARAAEAGRTVSVAGSGHSFTEAALTDGTLVDVASLSGVIDADRESGLVRVGGGTVLADLNEELARLGLAMENLGDIDRQTIAGAIATGTHGTGARLRNISSQVEAIELVTGDGTVRELTAGGDPATCCAPPGSASAPSARSPPSPCAASPPSPCTGSTRPARPRRSSPPSRSAPTPTTTSNSSPSPTPIPPSSSSATAPASRPAHAAASPPTSTTSCSRTGRWRRSRRPARRCHESIPTLSRLAARLASGSRATDRSDRIFANERRVRFTEMEYGVPRQHGPEAARRVIEWVRANRYPVFFPIEMRVTAGDDALLSPSHERDTAYIAVHQYRGMEWRPYFEAVEADHGRLRRSPPLGQAPLPDGRDPGAPLPALGRLPGAPATSWTRSAPSQTPTPPASSAPKTRG